MDAAKQQNVATFHHLNSYSHTEHPRAISLPPPFCLILLTSVTSYHIWIFHSDMDKASPGSGLSSEDLAYMDQIFGYLDVLKVYGY
jgi:hypothetical protein